jgi:hypothetical protein
MCHATKVLGSEAQPVVVAILPDRLPLFRFSSSSLELDEV